MFLLFFSSHDRNQFISLWAREQLWCTYCNLGVLLLWKILYWNAKAARNTFFGNCFLHIYLYIYIWLYLIGLCFYTSPGSHRTFLQCALATYLSPIWLFMLMFLTRQGAFPLVLRIYSSSPTVVIRETVWRGTTFAAEDVCTPSHLWDGNGQWLLSCTCRDACISQLRLAHCDMTGYTGGSWLGTLRFMTGYTGGT